MATMVYVEDELFENIANAIRVKRETVTPIKPSQMHVEVSKIQIIMNTRGQLTARTLTSCVSTKEDGGVIELAPYALAHCTALYMVKLDYCTIVKNHGFYMSRMLTEVDLPRVETLEMSAFGGCVHLKVLDFPSVKTIGRYAFNGCNKLVDLTLRSDTMVDIYDAEVFSDTLFSYGKGHIRVPANLVEQYKADSAWGTYANLITAIS